MTTVSIDLYVHTLNFCDAKSTNYTEERRNPHIDLFICPYVVHGFRKGLSLVSVCKMPYFVIIRTLEYRISLELVLRIAVLFNVMLMMHRWKSVKHVKGNPRYQI